MPIKKQWICDGCDKEVTTELEAMTDYYTIKVTVGAWGKHVVICPDCHTKLLKTVDPATWGRAPMPAPRPC